MLSPREMAVLRLIGQAKANKEIAVALDLSVGTVKEYNFHLFRKIGVTNRTEAALWLRDHPEACPASGRTEQFSPQAQGVPSSLGAAQVVPDFQEMA